MLVPGLGPELILIMVNHIGLLEKLPDGTLPGLRLVRLLVGLRRALVTLKEWFLTNKLHLCTKPSSSTWPAISAVWLLDVANGRSSTFFVNDCKIFWTPHISAVCRHPLSRTTFLLRGLKPLLNNSYHKAIYCSQFTDTQSTGLSWSDTLWDVLLFPFSRSVRLITSGRHLYHCTFARSVYGHYVQIGLLHVMSIPTC